MGTELDDLLRSKIWKMSEIAFPSETKMGTELADLLRSKRDTLTPQEESILLEWKERAAIRFTAGYTGGSGVAWLATHMLPDPRGRALTLGAGTVCGVWLLLGSVEPYIDHILSMEGSRTQRELANIFLKNCHSHRVQSILSKHFFPEEVYDDSSVDKPTRVWRCKNSFVDPLARFPSIFSGQETDSKENNMKKTTIVPEQVDVGDAESILVPKQVDVSAGDNSVENPFDSILGLAENAEDVLQLETPTVLSRREKLRGKWSRRRRRLQRDEKERDI